jgi:peptidoglycan/LPS O-acetylase OafA/YrhL
VTPTSVAVATPAGTQRVPIVHALDGLRGLAAIAVVTFHYKALLGGWHFPSAYLAVDLFFIISGVVICLNYEERLRGGMGTLRFLGRRLVRLAPLYWIALMLGAAVAAMGIMAGTGKWSWSSLAPVMIAGFLMLPNPFPSPRADLFPLDPPCWSLFWELAVNLAYALLLPWLGRQTLLTVIGAGALALIILAQRAGGLDFGYDWHRPAIPALRVIVGFSIGVLIARHARKRRLPEAGTSIFVLLGIAVVLLAAPASWGWAKDVVIALGFFPMLCAAAMRSRSKRTGLSRTLGLISYPLYVLHAVIPFETLATTILHRESQELAPGIGVAALVVAITVSWLLGAGIDGPVRAVLRRNPTMTA